MPRINLISLRQGTAAQWTSANPVLGVGEPGLESDTRKIKYGDGTTAWSSLAYAGGGASVAVSDTPPSNPEGIWWNSAEGRAYIYYDNTWVDLSPGVPGPTGPTGVVLSDTAPTNTSQIWADSSATGSYIVPANGSKGQVLTKVSDTSYDTGWITPQGSGNAIINGAFDIWQRGTSFSNPANNAYTADRWKVQYNATPTFTVSQQTFTPGTAPVAGYEGTFYLRDQITSGSTSTVHQIAQPIEDVRSFAGQTVTISGWVKSDSSRLFGFYADQNFGSGGSSTVYNAIQSSNLTATTSWQRFTFTATLPSIAGKTIGTGSHLLWGIGINAPSIAQTLEFWGVQLEAGSIATPFRRNAPSIQAELAACQRYYQRIDSTGNSTTGPLGQFYTVNSGRVFWNLPVTMRTSPTVTTSGLQGNAIGNGASTFSSFSGVMSSPNMVTYDLIGSSVNRSQFQALVHVGIAEASAEL